MNLRPLARRLPTALVMLLVVAAYGFFATGGTYDYPRIKWEESRYAAQAEGFLRGQLHMAFEADPKLRDLPDPYNKEMRDEVGAYYVWDGSYYRGKYYLYFSPLPIFFFYIPLKFLRGAYPPDNFVASLFCVWSFLAASAFVWRALRLRGARRWVPLPVWVALVGMGSMVPFLLVDIRMYEVAIMGGMAMTSTWAYSLIRFLETPGRRSVLWMSFWLAMAIASRPNLGVLLFVAAAAIWKAGDRATVRKLFAWALIPLGITCLAMLAYNQARFRSPLEFGVKYQLTFVPMRDYRVCSVCNVPEVLRVVNGVIHYLFWPPTVGSEFPFADVQVSRLDPAVAFPGGSEQVAGVVVLVPITLLGGFFATLLGAKRGARDLPTRAALQTMSGALLVMLGLSACWFVTARYSLDFMTLMTIAAIVCIESGLGFLQANDFAVRPLRIAAIVLACYSVLVGSALGFMGTFRAFERLYPELYKSIAKQFPKYKAPL